MTFKITTWNLNSIKMRMQHLRHFLISHNPDIVLLQELKCETQKFPYDELSDLPYNFYIHGQKTFNGVAILSKFPADEVTTNFIGNPCPTHSRFIEILIQTPIGYCRIISVYVPNGGDVDSDQFMLKLKFFDTLIHYLESKKNSLDEKLIIGGDFNVAPFDIDVYSPKALNNSTCFTEQEKRRLRSILNMGFDDLFRVLNNTKQEFTWWDYRAGAFEYNKGMRLDFILTSSNTSSLFKNCTIDYHTRAQSKASDHAPVIAF